MEKPCDLCGKVFDTATRNMGKGRQRYCSAPCRSKAQNQQYWRRRNPKKHDSELSRCCVICGVTFQADQSHPNAKTCSEKCNNARQNAKRRRETAESYERLPERECAECGALFKPHAFATERGKYCSSGCATRFRAKADSRYRAKVNGAYNKRLQSKEWRTARVLVIARDAATCRVCGGTEKRMSVHHLFDEHDHSPENLITVCGPCHHDLHSFVLKSVNGKVVISGPIFDYLGVTVLEVVQ